MVDELWHAKSFTEIIDDIDGTLLDPGEGESVHFSIDGKGYEVDLTEENARKLRDAHVAVHLGGSSFGRQPLREAPPPRRIVEP